MIHVRYITPYVLEAQSGKCHCAPCEMAWPCDGNSCSSPQCSSPPYRSYQYRPHHEPRWGQRLHYNPAQSALNTQPFPFLPSHTHSHVRKLQSLCHLQERGSRSVARGAGTWSLPICLALKLTQTCALRVHPRATCCNCYCDALWNSLIIMLQH